MNQEHLQTLMIHDLYFAQCSPYKIAAVSVEDIEGDPALWNPQTNSCPEKRPLNSL